MTAWYWVLIYAFIVVCIVSFAVWRALRAEKIQLLKEELEELQRRR